MRLLARLCVLAVAGQLVPQGAPTFRAGIDIVRLDVSVLDKNRQPVRGLTAADFSVLEDGNPQKVVAFAAVDIADPPPAPVVDGKPVTWMRDVAPDVQSNASAVDKPESRLFVLLVDDAMIPFDPWMIQNTKKIAKSVIDKLGPLDRMAVVLSAGSDAAHDFTSDHQRLLATVDKMHPGYASYLFGWNTIEPEVIHRPVHGTPVPERLNDDDIAPREWSFKTLQSVAEALLASPERRKSLIYVSPGIPVNPGDTGPVQMGRVRDAAVIHEANVHLFGEMPELFRRMQRAGIVVYAVDPTGLDGLNNFVRRSYEMNNVKKDYSQSDNIDPQSGKPGGGVPSASALAHFVSNLSLDFLLAAAENTGGKAIVNTNDAEFGIQGIFHENSSFYLLGYQAPSTNPPGTLHRLTVRVNRKDVTVRTRSGYYTDKPEKLDPKHPPPTPMAKAVANLLPSAALPLKVVLAPLAWPPSLPSPVPPKKPGKPSPLPEATVAVILGLERPAISKPLSDTVDVQISAFTPDGVARGTSKQIAQVAIRPTTNGETVRYEALSHIELKPGRYELRIAAYSGVSDVTGSVFASVDVPDFAADPVSLSGVFLSSTPGVPSAPRATLAALLPLVPTAERTFQKLDRATAFLRVYQGGKMPIGTVTLTTRIVNERDERVVNRTQTLAPDRFDSATRSAEIQYELPIVTLVRGEFLLSCDAQLDGVSSKPDAKAGAHRDLRFTLK